MIDRATPDDAGFWADALRFALFPVLEFGDEPGRRLPDADGFVAPVILSHDATNSPGRRHDHA